MHVRREKRVICPKIDLLGWALFRPMRSQPHGWPRQTECRSTTSVQRQGAPLDGVLQLQRAPADGLRRGRHSGNSPHRWRPALPEHLRSSATETAANCFSLLLLLLDSLQEKCSEWILFNVLACLRRCCCSCFGRISLIDATVVKIMLSSMFCWVVFGKASWSPGYVFFSFLLSRRWQCNVFFSIFFFNIL